MHRHRLWIVTALLVATSAVAQDDDDDEQPPGLRARYQSGESVIERVDPDVAFVWADAAPDDRLPAGKFTARWDGSLLLRTQDKYRFHAFAQGRVAWKVGGQIVLEGESAEPQWISGPEIALSFGDQPFELSFTRTGDAAQLKLYWSSTEFPLEPVPYHALFQTKPSPELALVERGRVQFEAFRCTNCHDRGSNQPHLAAPSLKHIGVGTRREWLVEKLTASLIRAGGVSPPVPDRENPPGGLRPPLAEETFAKGKMPHFGFTHDDAEAIVAALLSDATPVELIPARATKDSERTTNVQTGRTLIRSVGCLACHTWNKLGEATPFGGGSLDDIATRRSAEWLVTWLADPGRLNAQHRMPVFTLTEKERTQIVLALQTPSSPKGSQGEPGAVRPRVQSEEPGALRHPARPESQQELVVLGRKLIASNRCATCHELPGTQPPVASVNSLGRPDVNWSKSCTHVSEPAIRQPTFPQVDASAIQAYVTSWQGREPSSLALDSPLSTLNSLPGLRILERKNCLGCHDRDSVRGISMHAAVIAQADESLNGLHMTLIPPRLNAVGDRMLDEALATAVRGEQKTRRLDWLRVRMPKFQHSPGEQAALVAHLIGHDRIPAGGPTKEPFTLTLSPQGRGEGTKPKPDPQRLLAGRELLGGKGFSCVACHAVKDYTPKVTALGTRGSNLHLIGQRMRTDYFVRWTRAPLRVMPGVEMPNYQRPHEFILPGKLDEQLTAIWEALNDPNLTAPTNPAVVEQLLTVHPGERPRIVRDVFTVPGGKEGETVARAFAIGFDNGHSLLFDLDTGSVRGWTLGDFARQRCEGKRWYWDLAGVPLATGFDPRPDILLVDTKTANLLAPETGWRYATKLVSYSGDGLRYRLTVSRGDSEFSADVEEVWMATSVPSGCYRLLTVTGIKETPLWPWYRGASPESLHERTTIAPISSPVDKAEVDRPRGLPATSRPFGRSPGGIASLAIHFTSPLKRVLATDIKSTGSLVSVVERITTVPGFRGERLPLPRSIMPTAMTFDDDQRLLFTSLKGHVFRVEPATKSSAAEHLTTLHEGLAAPFGIHWHRGYNMVPLIVPRLIVAHKPELLGLRLTLNDFETVSSCDVLATGWGLTDDYHDWTCGIARDSKGNMFIGLASDYTFKNRPKEKSKWRGDILQIDPAGKIESIARGLRYPTGLAVDDRDRLFVTDQQGVQNTFNELNYIQPGHRYGVPSRHEPEPNAPADPPAAQIPHPWTRSVNGIVFVAGKKPSAVSNQRSAVSGQQSGSVLVPSPPSSGERARVRGLNGEQAPDDGIEEKTTPHPNPLPSKARGEGTGEESANLFTHPTPLDSIAGHFLGCEYNNNMLVRMSVQDVDGVVQGAAYPFSRPMAESAPLSADAAKRPMPQDASSFIGPICIAISPGGEIYVGGFQDGGWAGGLNMGDIVKLTPDGKLPNGIREIRATPRGFDIEFVHPVDPKLATQTSPYKISGYTRVWQGDYATPDSGHHTGEVRSAELSDDKRRVSLVVHGLKPGHVYDVSVGEIGTGDNRNLWPAMGHYTLHRIPR